MTTTDDEEQEDLIFAELGLWTRADALLYREAERVRRAENSKQRSESDDRELYLQLKARFEPQSP
jgi:hypothetical protein